MLYEIDYFPIGEETKGGDAIMITYGEDLSNRDLYKIVIIDCGNKQAADNMISHLQQMGTNKVDLVIATHLHSDHVSGIPTLIENLEISKIALHQPRNHASEIKKISTSQSSVGRLESKIEKSLSSISGIVDLATEKGIDIIEPFAGENIIDNMWILGPDKEYYTNLAANFGKVPVTPNEENMIEKAIHIMKDVKDTILNRIDETFDIETLSDDYEDTGPENNSSMIIYFAPEESKKMLFTGDAGKESLLRAIQSYGNYIENLDFLDVPHHGSKRNLGPTILDKIKPKTAFISCPLKGDPKHPSRKVVNALIRRGTNVHSTKGSRKLHHNTGGRGRPASVPESFYNQVEE